MVRRLWIGVMVLAFLASIASLIETSMTRSKPCPACGSPMQWIDGQERSTFEEGTWELLDLYRCHRCEYEVILAAPESDR
jgi:hypothetical protein